MAILIRPIARDDLSDVLDLMAEFAAFEKLEASFTATEEKLESAMFADDSNVEGMIAFDDAIAVGYALYFPTFSSFRGERSLFLEDLYLSDKVRGRGLGKMMLRRIAAIASSRGRARIDFWVLDWNASAIAFYKKLGAEHLGGGELHFKFAGEAFDALRN